ncbi:hypothetical protein M9458_052270 [Cirrhinus mrigala]|uniref:Uncharacterized protein n=1 Tax=Cirrhinus mrigala TaxID=683832 RepID=A0ABD0MUT7_CIRMR
MATKQEVTHEAAEGAITESQWVRAPSAGVALQNPPPIGATPGAQNNNNSPGGWGNRGKTGGGTGGQVCAEEVGLDRGAGTDSEALEDLDRGSVADSGTLEDLDCGAMADTVPLEQNSTMFDSEEPGAMVEQGEPAAMVGQAEQEAMAGQAEQEEQGAIAGQTEQAEQTGAKISTVALVTSIAEHRVHD